MGNQEWRTKAQLLRYEPLEQRFAAGASQEFLKPAIPDYLVGALTSFPLHCQIKK